MRRSVQQIYTLMGTELNQIFENDIKIPPFYSNSDTNF